MPLADYLAQHYLSASGPAPAKKRKRKQPKDTSSSNGLTIADDDVDTWTRPHASNDDDDEDTPTIVGGLTIPSAGKVKKAKWITVGSSAPKDSEQAAADAILASAAAESNARAAQDDDAPAIVNDAAAEAAPTMASGAAAGLQTAAQVSASLRRKHDAEMAAMKDAGLDMGGLAQQTIYRDASGRRINVKEKKAEAAEKAEEAARKAREEELGARGDVQRREAEERKMALMEAKTMTVARGKDDVGMNEELKQRERWNDPMAKLLSKSGGGGGKTTGSSRGKAKKGKEYMGAFEPNRYGIRPGWRWDGVDRGNGFERKWFAARNKKKDREALEYAWQMDE